MKVKSVSSNTAYAVSDQIISMSNIDTHLLLYSLGSVAGIMEHLVLYPVDTVKVSHPRETVIEY